MLNSVNRLMSKVAALFGKELSSVDATLKLYARASNDLSNITV